MIFSERYKELIDVGHGESKDNICGEIEFNIKKKIAEVLVRFAEPKKYQVSRYNNLEEETTALESAIERLSDILGYSIISMFPYGMADVESALASVFTPYLFDIIELQYIELSDKEKPEFEKTLNGLFAEKDIPWILHNDRLIKIDAKQFELDVKAKTLALIKELKDCDAVFQAPFNELTTALEFWEKGSYAEAISNAEKSYESVLKILCNVNRGNADKLTKQVLEINICNIPESMTTEGFREKVLLSLPYVRNNSTASHGSGKEVVEITKEMANLSINMAAALNTYLIESYVRNVFSEKEDE